MTLFLRDNGNRDVAEVEIYEKTEDGKKFTELSSVVSIGQFSALLLTKINDPILVQMIDNFDFLQEIRGWYYESFLTEHKDATFDESLEQIRKFMQQMAKAYGLGYTED